MNQKVVKSCQKIMIWLLAEVLLNFCGLDTLADYSEFIAKAHQIKDSEKLSFQITRTCPFLARNII
jgi:uncharacterized membrane protein